MNTTTHPRKDAAIEALAWDIAHGLCYAADIDGCGYNSDNPDDVAAFLGPARGTAERYYRIITNTLDGGA